MKARCQECGAAGKLGWGVRTYEVTSPIAVFDVRLCYDCFDKQRKRERPHVHIKERS